MEMRKTPSQIHQHLGDKESLAGAAARHPRFQELLLLPGMCSQDAQYSSAQYSGGDAKTPVSSETI